MLALRLPLKIASHSLNCPNVEKAMSSVILMQFLPSLSPDIRLYTIPYNEFDGCHDLFHGSSVYGLVVGLAYPCMQSNTVAFYKTR